MGLLNEKCGIDDHCWHYIDGYGGCCTCGKELDYCPDCGWVRITGEIR